MAQLKGNDRSAFVASMFGRISRRYDLLNTLMTVGMHYMWRRKAAQLAATHVSGDILDVASGTGDFAFDLLKHSNVNIVVGLDFSPEMLDVAIRKSVKLGLDGRFASATVGFGVRNFFDLPKALADIVRVTRRGGKVTVLEIVRPQDRLSSVLFLRYFRWVTPKLGKIFAGDYEAYKYLPESVQHFMSAKQLTKLLKEAGLRNINVETKGMGSIAIISGERP